MSRNFPADTRRQRALEELYEKEIISQLRFFCRQQQEAKKADETIPESIANFDCSPVAAVRRRKIHLVSQGLSSTFKKNVEETPKSAKNKSAGAIDESYQSDSSDIPMNFSEMRPVDNEIRKLIYDGISKESKGRAQYLKQRTQLPPGERYCTPVISSMEYGWNFSELHPVEENIGPKHARIEIVKSTFYKRTGLPLRHMDEML